MRFQDGVPRRRPGWGSVDELPPRRCSETCVVKMAARPSRRWPPNVWTAADRRYRGPCRDPPEGRSKGSGTTCRDGVGFTPVARCTPDPRARAAKDYGVPSGHDRPNGRGQLHHQRRSHRLKGITPCRRGGSRAGPRGQRRRHQRELCRAKDVGTARPPTMRAGLVGRAGSPWQCSETTLNRSNALNIFGAARHPARRRPRHAESLYARYVGNGTGWATTPISTLRVDQPIEEDHLALRPEGRPRAARTTSGEGGLPQGLQRRLPPVARDPRGNLRRRRPGNEVRSVIQAATRRHGTYPMGQDRQHRHVGGGREGARQRPAHHAPINLETGWRLHGLHDGPGRPGRIAVVPIRRSPTNRSSRRSTVFNPYMGLQGRVLHGGRQLLTTARWAPASGRRVRLHPQQQAAPDDRPGARPR